MYTYEFFFSRISKAGSEYNLSTNIYIATRQRNIKTNICCLERESSGKMEEEEKIHDDDDYHGTSERLSDGLRCM